MFSHRLDSLAEKLSKFIREVRTISLRIFGLTPHLRRTRKGVMTGDQFVYDNTNRKEINTLIPTEHLNIWGHVIRRANQCVAKLTIQTGSNVEVDQLEIAIFIQHQIPWLDVAMQIAATSLL